MTSFVNWTDLAAALAALPPPAAGHLHFYRGQTRDYPTLVPTGLRSPRSADDVWLLFSGLMAKLLLATEKDKGRAGLELETQPGSCGASADVSA